VYNREVVGVPGLFADAIKSILSGMVMKSVKREDGWWVTKIPECSDIGPYGTKAEADEHKCDLKATFDNLDNWSFWTTEPEPK
jgi:hypothetical protein